MTRIAESLRDRIRDSLDSSIPVLLADQLREINSGGKPGQPAGVATYLKIHPQGWVTVNYGFGILSNGLTDTGFITVDVVAPDMARAELLAREVRARIGSIPTWPTPFTFQGEDTDLNPSYFRLILTFQTRSIGV